MPETVRIGLVLPDVMGTYGDGGNAVVLRQRLLLRGIPAEIVEITLAEPVPDSLDLYTLGGAEDYAQRLATRHLLQHPGLQRAAARGVHSIPTLPSIRKKFSARRLASPRLELASSGVASKSARAAMTARQVM